MSDTAAQDASGCTPGAPLLGEMYCGYASDPEVRVAASSGGIVSSVLLSLLESGTIDAAIVSGISSADGQVTAISRPVESREAVLAAAGSAYIYTPVIAAVRQLEGTERRVAVVALPCQARAIRELLDKRPALRRNVVLLIGLFCRGAVRSQFYDDLLRKKGIDPGRVEEVKVARGHVRGEVRVALRDGRTASIDFFELNAYRTAGFHAHPGCLQCTKHLAESADISVGDIFTAEYKQRPIKHSCFVARTEAGLSALRRLHESGAAVNEYFGTQRYAETFRKIERFCAELAPRACAACLTGVGFRGKRLRACNPFHVLSWMLFQIDYRATRNALGRRVLYALPPAAVKAASVLIKGLSKL